LRASSSRNFRYGLKKNRDKTNATIAKLIVWIKREPQSISVSIVSIGKSAEIECRQWNFYNLPLYALVLILCINYKKSEANARRPGTSQRAIAVSIFALISPEAEGLRPIAFIAPIPIRPIPSPEPITPSRASPSIYVKDEKLK
jgi:hypothetical protein